MEFFFDPTSSPNREQENAAHQAFYENITFACTSCRGENTVETKDLPRGTQHYGETTYNRDGNVLHYKVSCLDCGDVTPGVLPRRFSFSGGSFLRDIADVEVGNVVVGWGVVAAIGRDGDGIDFIVTTENGFTFDCPDADEVIVMPDDYEHPSTKEGHDV